MSGYQNVCLRVKIWETHKNSKEVQATEAQAMESEFSSVFQKKHFPTV